MYQGFEKATGRAENGREIDRSKAARPAGDAPPPQVPAPALDLHQGPGRGVVLGGEFAGLLGAEFVSWLRQMERLGGCTSPVYLVGHTITTDRATGEVLHVFSSASQPYGRFAVGCRNRRESVCPPCAYLHHGDTYQLVVAGLAGGKGVPAGVVSHPRVFATLTAPSFGAVHRATDPENPADRCHPRRDASTCAHGVPATCYRRHVGDDPVVGEPLCPACYDYPGAVLWNASVGALWDRFVRHVRRELARRAGVRIVDLPRYARVSFAKVTEYQKRGSVHLHAVIRVDGPDGPGDPAPGWASAALLCEVVKAAGPRVWLRITAASGWGTRTLTFGPQLDMQEITPAAGLDRLSDRAVAAYIAKYVTKGDLPGLVLAHRLRSSGQIEATPGLSAHARRLMRTAWVLGGEPEYEGLRLRLWAHQLGFRGNIATKSRMYSTTYAALRQARAQFHHSARFDPATTETDSVWRFAGVGHSPTQAVVAAGIARGVLDARDARPGRARAGRRGLGGGRGSAADGRLVEVDRVEPGAVREAAGAHD